MSAMSVEVPYPVFYDRNGEPLENGYVWIGTANLNPQTNPIQVYFDRNLTQPAQQPLRTVAGYISNAGTPSQIYINGNNYSIMVLDKNGTMVYNFSDGTGIAPIPNNACGLAYTPDFPNAVTRPTCERLEESVSVKDFGATGDGVVANEQPFIQAAIDAVQAAGGGVVFVPKGIYKLTQQIILKPGVALIGEGSGVTIFDIGTTGITMMATLSVPSTKLIQTTNLLPGDESNTIPNTCQAGDFIQYQNNLLFDQTRWAGRVVRDYYYEAELFDIKSANSSSVTFTEGAVANCPVATTKNVEFFTPSSYITIKGFTLRKSASVINFSNGVNIYRAKYVWIDDIATENFDFSGINIEQSMYLNVGTTRHIGGSSSLGLNYGVFYADGTKHAVHQSLFGKNNRHTFTSGGSGYAIPMYVTLLSANITDSTSHSVDCHGNSAYFTINNCNCDNGIAVCGLGHKVSNCIVTSLDGESMPYEGGQGIVYSNIVYRGKRDTGIRVYTNENVIESTFENIDIEADKFQTLVFRSGSRQNVFKNWRLVCSSVATATSSANADTFFTIDSRSFGVLTTQCLCDGLYLEGIPSPLQIVQADIQILNVFLQDCGWQNSFTTEDAAILVTSGGGAAKGDRTFISNVRIYNKNSNLTWTARTIRLEPVGTTVDNVTIQHVWDGLTPIGNVNFYISLVTSNVTNLFLQNVRIRNGGGGSSFAAASGKYIFQTLTADN